LKTSDITFSVIVPVYNRAETILRAIESVLSQSRLADEIIVVDDGSDDRTALVLQKHSEKIQLIQQQNKGVSSARNTGIKSSSGNWIALLDSDDQWLPDKLLMAERFIKEHPNSLVFQSEELWVRNGKRVNPKNKHKKYDGYIYKQSLPLCIVSPSAALIKRSLFDELGYFDESLPVCEDYDMWLRVSRKYPIGLDPIPGIIKYGGHPDQLSAKYWGMDRFRIIAMEKQLADLDLPDKMRYWTLKEVVSKIKILINGYKKRDKDYKELNKKLDLYSDIYEQLKF